MNHRIAFVSGGIKLGGATTFLLNLGEELNRRKVPVLVISLEHDNPYARDFQARRIPLHIEDDRTRIFEDRLTSVLCVLRDWQPTIVVACLGPSSFEILRYVPANIQRIGMVQSDDPLVYQTVTNYAAYMTAVAGVSATIVERLKKIEALREIEKLYLPYGVRIPPSFSRKESDAPLRILYLGRISNEQKRVYLFPKIADQLQAARVRFKWTIAGDGPDRPQLERDLKSHITANRVQFVGAIDYGEIGRVLAEHSIFLLASDYEGLPLSLLEAMANGVVPVVSDLESGLREVVDQTNGMLVPVDNEDGYARAIIELDADRERLRAKSVAARARVEKEFSVGAMVERWIAVMKSHEVITWPGNWQIRSPILAPNQWKYAFPIRTMRRIVKNLTGKFQK